MVANLGMTKGPVLVVLRVLMMALWMALMMVVQMVDYLAL
jgi:hypothetical protein